MSSNESEAAEVCLLQAEDEWPSDDEEIESFLDWNEENSTYTSSDDEEFSNEISMNYERINLENCQLIWCGEQTEISNYKVLIGQLRQIVDYTVLFNNVTECRKFLKQTRDTGTFLVCSYVSAETLVPKIHQLNHIRCIYVLRHHEQIRNELTTGFAKMKQIEITDLSSLSNDLIKEVESYLRQTRNDIFNGTIRTNNTTDGKYFSWWQKFVDIIGYLPYPDQCRQTFIQTFENYYQGNQANLETLKLFNKTYTSESALTWYTRDTFLFRVLNSTLRQHNIPRTFIFGFFIKDMFNQLKKEYDNFQRSHLNEPLLKVYRAQKLPTKEFTYLIEERQQSGNYEIHINSFFSATTNRSYALILSEIPDDHREKNMEYILFEIKIDLRTNSRPFANITSLSAIRDEDEVLFMRDTRFRIYDISYDEQMKIHLIKLVLAHHDEEVLIENLIGTTMKTTLKNCLSIIPEELYKAKKLEINTIFMELNDLYPTEKGWFEAIRLHSIAKKNDLYDWNKKLLYYKEAINIYEMYLNDNELNFAVDIALIHLDIGYYYQIHKAEDHSLLHEHYELGIIVCEYSLLTMINKEARAKLYETILKILKEREKLSSNYVSDYIKYQELHIQEMLHYCSLNNSYVAEYLIQLADRQKSIFLFEKALDNYEKAIEMYCSNSQSKTNVIADIYAKISEMYNEQRQDFANAAHFKEIQIEYLLKSHFPDPCDSRTELEMIWQQDKIGESQQELADIYIKLHQYSLAHELLIKTQTLYESISEIYPAEDHLNDIKQRIIVVVQKLSEKEIS